jgi:hypothetical protein
MMFNSTRSILSFIVILVALQGCAANIFGSRSPNPDAPIDFSELKLSQHIPADQMRVIPVIISKESFLNGIESTAGLPAIRLVRVYQNVSGGIGGNVRSVPEYRMFHVHQKGPFGILGLKDGDVLVGLNDRVVTAPDMFRFYPQALLADSKSQLIYRRSGKLFKAEIEIH